MEYIDTRLNDGESLEFFHYQIGLNLIYGNILNLRILKL